jgi:rhamnosyltransferase
MRVDRVTDLRKCRLGLKTLASVVLYNPDIGRLSENVSAVIEQVDHVLFVDNGSLNLALVHEVFDGDSRITFVENNKNLGIAAALSVAMENAIRFGFEWVLALDQDSVCRPGLVDEYLKYAGLKDVGILTCVIVDRNFQTPIVSPASLAGPQDVNQCITSGSFTSVAAYQKTDGYDSSLFIDAVDFDLCINMRRHGYRIVRIPFEGLLHEVGHGRNVKLLGKGYVVYNHGPVRHYYMARNHMILLKKYPGEYSTWLEILREVRAEILVLLYEGDKFAKLKSRWRGLRDVRTWSPNDL